MLRGANTFGAGMFRSRGREDAIIAPEARRAMGLEALQAAGEGDGERALLKRANEYMGF